MTAKEMFNELGFKKTNNPCLLVTSEVAYAKGKDEDNKLIVAFVKMSEQDYRVHLERTFCGEKCEVVIEKKLQKAIDKQLEEFGIERKVKKKLTKKQQKYYDEIVRLFKSATSNFFSYEREDNYNTMFLYTFNKLLNSLSRKVREEDEDC